LIEETPLGGKNAFLRDLGRFSSIKATDNKKLFSFKDSAQLKQKDIIIRRMGSKKVGDFA
jgi:hypothetical protein